jgi:ubiquitin carboxyl-terminal hydrolase L5
MSSNDWCTIESDPGVFTELVEQWGCGQVELEELWTLDAESFQHQFNGTVVYGLILLFQWNQPQQQIPEAQQEQHKSDASMTFDNDDLYFARQVTTNACATQALLSVILNAPSLEDTLGSSLTLFKSFTSSFSPELKGEAIGASDELRQAHNQFRRRDLAVLFDGTANKRRKKDEEDEEDVFHFVAYIGKNGQVYELDGLQPAPIMVGTYNEAAVEHESGAAWLSVARDAIQQRMDANPNIIKFNLMAVIQDRRIALQQALTEPIVDEEDDVRRQVLEEQLATEQAKRDRWTLENQRRRHNYIPVCVGILQELAKAGHLPNLIQDAKMKRQNQKRNRSQN